MIVDALSYVIDELQLIDPTKISYNNWYSTPDFILSKFPESVIETDFLIPVLQDLVESKKGQDPLTELQKRYLVNSNK
jgi:hypothetical protein